MSQERASACHVACRLPDFFSDDPELWFDKCESAFRRSRITSSITKYDYVLEKLPTEVTKSIRDLIRSISDDTADAYEQVKTRLVQAYKPSKWCQLYKVINHPDLGGSRPSALLSSMLALMPVDEKPTDLFTALFLQKLPVEMREQLSAQKFETVHAMAATADNLWSARSQGSSVAAISNRGRSPNRQQSPRRQPRSQTPSDRFCFYHAMFGPRAKKCQPGCSYVPGNVRAASNN